MSHDITHCTNDHCEKRNECHRYLMWLELCKLPANMLDQPFMWTDGKWCARNEHAEFWQAKQPESYTI